MHTIHTSGLRSPIHNSALCLRAALLLGCAFATLASCSVLERSFGAAPIECRDVAVVLGDRGTLHRIAGIHYELASVAPRAIAAFEVAFDLFDESDRPIPGLGDNSFRSVVRGRIEPGELRRFSVSLDSIPGHSYEELRISRFRVSRVEFDDGSLWRNSGAHLYEEDDS